jgi:repressor LexA
MMAKPVLCDTCQGLRCRCCGVLQDCSDSWSPVACEILKFIHTRVTEKGYPPTVREIGEAVQLSSTSTVHGHLSRLEKKGLILRDPTKPRAIELTSSGLEKIDVQPASIPMLGVVTAGEPILAVEDASDFFPIPPDLANSTGSLFMLTIRGESMINAGILDGDQVIVRKQQSAQNGDIVIAMTDEDEATCKRFYKEKNYIRLQPENDYLEPIILPDVTILGLVVGLYRHLL